MMFDSESSAALGVSVECPAGALELVFCFARGETYINRTAKTSLLSAICAHRDTSSSTINSTPSSVIAVSHNLAHSCILLSPVNIPSEKGPHATPLSSWYQDKSDWVQVLRTVQPKEPTKNVRILYATKHFILVCFDTSNKAKASSYLRTVHGMKAYKVGSTAPVFLISTLHRAKLSASLYGRLFPEQNSSIHTESEAGWAPDLICQICRRQITLAPTED
jgi:hypothetical protein